VLGHSHIEKDKVRLLRADRLEGSSGGIALPENLYFGIRAQQVKNIGAGERLIVHNQGANSGRSGLGAHLGL
jgi:aldehyde:ferredoxin oxidoreductase